MAKLTFLPTGRTYEVAPGTSYLDFCQQHPEVPQDFGCTVGSCGTCRLVPERGAESLNPISSEEHETLAMCTDAPGARLGCQLVLGGDVAVRPVE
jgi:2Fe-2S ferredoxin